MILSGTDVFQTIRSCTFNRNDLEVYANKTGSGRGALEKDFVISEILLVISQGEAFSEFANRIVFRGGTMSELLSHSKAHYADSLTFCPRSLVK
jgi:predicted nucleotidyltransferase component of viral defense system